MTVHLRSKNEVVQNISTSESGLIVNEGFFYDGGRIRGIPVMVGDCKYVPPIPFESAVRDQIDQIVSETKDVVETAIKLCLYCMKTQIFTDGNKRAAVIFANHYLISRGMGVLVIPAEKVAKFKELLVKYYEGNDDFEISLFLRENCWKCF